MKKLKALSLNGSKQDLYHCSRCSISTFTKDRMCPCPRGGCDAEVVGTIIKESSRTIKLNKKGEKIYKLH